MSQGSRHCETSEFVETTRNLENPSKFKYLSLRLLVYFEFTIFPIANVRRMLVHNEFWASEFREIHCLDYTSNEIFNTIIMEDRDSILVTSGFNYADAHYFLFDDARTIRSLIIIGEWSSYCANAALGIESRMRDGWIFTMMVHDSLWTFGECLGRKKWGNLPGKRKVGVFLLWGH